MKKSIFVIGILLIIGCTDSKKDNLEIKKYEEELQSHASSFMGELKSVLLANMKEGGPLQAVSVCSDTASALTETFAENNNIYVKRVSFKNRNQKNIPDKYETEVLNSFHSLAKDGSLNKNHTSIILISKEDKNFVHFMKPLFVEAPCLNCHGTKDQISSDVEDHINEKYPQDKAVDYKIGDLRGAISIMKEL